MKLLKALCAIAAIILLTAFGPAPGGGSSGGNPGGTSGQVQYNNNGILGGFTLSGGVTVNTSTGVATLGTVSTATSGDSSTAIANTQFVTYALAALNPLASVNEATIAILPNTPTYNNGTAGVGATLTRTGNGTLTVDGTVVALNDRVLVKNQASAFQNGVYVATAAGDGSNPWVLTRSTDYNTAANINSTGDVPVSAGGTLAGTLWLQTATIVTIGTDALTYIQVNAPQGSGGNSGGNTLSGDVTGKSNKNTLSSISGIAVSGGFSNCKTLVGTTPTLTPLGTVSPTKECFTEVLSGSTTLTGFASGAAPANMWTAHVLFTQPSGAHSYTLALSAGSGVTLQYQAAGGGCTSLPTMPTGTGNSLALDLLYNTNPSTPRLEVLSCTTDGS